jgi:hypothetical protein
VPSPVGYSGTPLPKKLGIKPGARVLTIDAPADFATTLGDLPELAEVQALSEPDVASLSTGDPVLCFLLDAAELARLAPMLREALVPDRAAWICWPKKASKVPTDITEDVIREIVLPTGLVDVKVCAVDATWSGLRIVVRKALR